MKQVGIVGLGLIGKERLRAVKLLQDKQLPVRVKAVMDPGQNDIQAIAEQAKAMVCSSIEEMIDCNPDLVIVAVPHDTAVGITMKLLSSNLNVLLEKPMGRSLAEANQIATKCSHSAQLLIAHNYRFFSGVAMLLQDIKAERFGQPIGFSLLLGHGGSPGDEKSWKLDKEKAGGGALIDPGIHLIDICNLVGEKLDYVGGASWSGFWKTNIEEECRLVMRSQNIPMIDLTVSIVRWRSTFRLEFFGKTGYGIVQGRGRSYGPQEYRRGQRWGWQSGKSQAESEELVVTSSCDEVFADELESVLFANNADGLRHVCTVSESIKNMEVLEQCREMMKIRQKT